MEMAIANVRKLNKYYSIFKNSLARKVPYVGAWIFFVRSYQNSRRCPQQTSASRLDRRPRDCDDYLID